MTVSGIHLMRLEIFGDDLARSLRFYEDVLGFKVDKTATAPTYDYVPIVNGNARIGLCLARTLPYSHYFQPTEGTRLGVGAEIVLEVEHLAEYETRARNAGAVKEAQQLRPWGMRDFRVVDPDGYYIRVTETQLGRPEHRAPAGEGDPGSLAGMRKASTRSRDDWQ
jgi:catechol 2,3-dioxygenase-like lactoylglutathione lyase family enzyme